MTYTQHRLVKKNGEIIQQVRLVITTTYSKWWKPWDVMTDTAYLPWQDVEIPEVAI